jgi:tetratricopeptide (TPR) repeat protein
LLLASRAARRAGRHQEAEQYLRSCERLLPQSDEVTLEWSLLRTASGDVDDQLEEFLQQQVQRDLSRVALVGEALTEGYARQYRIYEAFQCVDRWLKVQPDNVQALYLRGKLHTQTKKLQKGVPDFQRVVELDPTRLDARRWLALGLMESGRYAEALVHLDELQRRLPADANVVVHQARAYQGLQQVQQARRLLDSVLAEHPDNSAALRARGELELADQPALAEKYLRQAAKIAPNDYQIQHSLLRALTHQGKQKEEEAKALREQVDQLKERWERLGDLTTSKLSMRPHDPALHVELGNLFISLGQAENGRAWLERALRQDPSFRPAHAALAEYYRQAGDEEQAAKHGQQAGR